MSSNSPTTRKRSRPEEWQDSDPSPVIHVRGLPRHTLELDLVKVFSPFGSIRDITMMPQKGQALVEFNDITSAENAVLRNEGGVTISNHPVMASFSTSKRIVQRAANKAPAEEQETLSSDNHILLFTIYNADHPITAMVEFKSVKEARAAKLHLNGADIYPGTCSLKVDYARPTRLTVTRNDQDNWDYETGDHGTMFMNQSLENNFSSNSLLGPYDMGHNSGYEDSQWNNEGYGYPPFSHSYDANYRNAPMGMERKSNGRPFGQDHGWMGTPVIMLYNLDTERMNCDRVFNLLCLYGNVVRVKFLRTKEGSAMVQMGDPESADRVIKNLSGIPLMDKRLVVRTSKQDVILEVPHPYELFDNTPSFKEFSNCRNNRYSTPAMAKKNRVYPPSTTLHYWNAPPDTTVEDLKNIFVEAGVPLPSSIVPFSKTSEKSSSGILQWSSEADAFLALAICNHSVMKGSERTYPFVIKLAFASPSSSDGRMREFSSMDTQPNGNN